MRREDVYDVAVEKWGDKTAVVQWGDRFIIGRWIKLNVAISNVILHSKKYGKGVEVMGEGESWEEAMKSAGLLSFSQAAE